MRQHYVNFDIYAYNLKTGEESPVAVAPGSQRSPAIHGHTVVWADNRNSPLAGAKNRELASPGCGDCPENRFDIYAMNLDTGEEQVLVENGYYNDVPDINGEYMAWRSYDPERLPEIRLLDLESGIVHTMVQDGNFWSGPSLSEQYLVWSTSWSCDVVVPGRDIDYTGVFARDLNKGEIRKLTDYVEPTALMSGNMVVISEFCQVPAAGRVYAVFLVGRQSPQGLGRPRNRTQHLDIGVYLDDNAINLAERAGVHADTGNGTQALEDGYAARNSPDQTDGWRHSKAEANLVIARGWALINRWDDSLRHAKEALEVATGHGYPEDNIRAIRTVLEKAERQIHK